MLTITHYRNPPRQDVVQQVLTMAAHSTPEMHMAQPEPSNPLYPLIELTLVMEIHLYMTLMGPTDVRKAGLLLATDEAAPGKVLGFLQYLSSTDMASACAITYLAVDAHHRRQGVARALMAELMKLHPHAALTCPVPKVPYYESLGFAVLCAKDTQVVMTSGGYRDQANCTVTDASKFLSNPAVLSLQSDLFAEHGLDGMLKGESLMKQRISKLEAEATKYAAARVAGAGHNEAVAGS